MGCVESCQAVEGAHTSAKEGGKAEDKQPTRYQSDVTMSIASSFANLSDIDVAEDYDEDESDDERPQVVVDRTGDYLRSFHSGLCFAGGELRVAIFTTFELEEMQIVLAQGSQSSDFYVLISSVTSFKTKLCPDFANLVSKLNTSRESAFPTCHFPSSHCHSLRLTLSPSQLISAIVRSLDAKFQTQFSERAREWSPWDCEEAVTSTAFPRDILPSEMAAFLQ